MGRTGVSIAVEGGLELEPRLLSFGRRSRGREGLVFQRILGEIELATVSQAMPATDWSAQASSRVKGPETLSGRDRLKTALAALGFPLA